MRAISRYNSFVINIQKWWPQIFATAKCRAESTPQTYTNSTWLCSPSWYLSPHSVRRLLQLSHPHRLQLHRRPLLLLHPSKQAWHPRPQNRTPSLIPDLRSRYLAVRHWPALRFNGNARLDSLRPQQLSMANPPTHAPFRHFLFRPHQHPQNNSSLLLLQSSEKFR